MGAWSTKPFGNDSALDFAGAISDSKSPSEVKMLILQSFADYAVYSGKRARGENKVVRTAEHAEWMLSQIAWPEILGVGDLNVIEAVRSGIGKEDIDTGSAEAFAAIAAGTILAALHHSDINRLPEDLHQPQVQAYRPNLPELEDAVSTLLDIQRNSELCRECGPAWKKGVKLLTLELKAAVALTQAL